MAEDEEEGVAGVPRAGDEAERKLPGGGGASSVDDEEAEEAEEEAVAVAAAALEDGVDDGEGEVFSGG